MSRVGEVDGGNVEQETERDGHREMRREREGVGEKGGRRGNAPLASKRWHEHGGPKIRGQSRVSRDLETVPSAVFARGY